jgi:flagellar biosynthetic protein FliR
MFALEFITLFSLFSRAFGFFTLSPLFKWQHFPTLLRVGFTFLITLLLAPTFLATQTLPQDPSLFTLLIIKEVAFGYCLGLIFSLLFEGVFLAGEMIGSMMGLSLTEIFDPIQNNPAPILSTLFALTTAALIFALDAHHLFIRTYFESFSILPLGSFTLSDLNVETVITATSQLFYFGLRFAFLPFCLLLMVALFLAFGAKLFPHMPILWLGLTAQLMVGLLAVGVNFSAFPDLIAKAVHVLIEQLRLLSSGTINMSY